MVDFTLWDIVSNLALAARWTVLLSLVAFVCGGLVGLAVTLLRVAPVPALRRAAVLYIELFQGTPLLMQLFVIFFALPLAGVETTPWAAAAAALTLFTSAYLAEIWRGCVDAAPRGQWEASAALAMSYGQQMRYVILPQALRLAVPPTVGFSVQVIKGTAVTSIIGFVELTKAGTMIVNATFQPFLVYGLVGLFYFVMCYPLSVAAKRLERNLVNVAR
ncbi:polar amino acid transport system permease protein [Azospirillum fermentarium]|uniref:amino acid ABC transporter permease n=1 Tax=Azospirillum fermentarium TaxID=1233114 RepID=UPI002225BD22|nr:amino acid ABC transporter permease [Azospirillum fermentarium]MCW2248470.1 polar amino acid transport system permease protein [Azospirillum fermentarium]